MTDTATPAPATPRARLGASATLLFVLATTAFRWGGAHPDLGDTIPTRLLAASIVRDHDLDLDELPGVDVTDPPYFLKSSGGHVYSRFPPGRAFLLVPVYALADALGVPVLTDEDARRALARWLGALACAATVTIIYVTLARLGPRRRALATAVVAGFGTAVWPVAAQDVWQHTFGLPLVAWCVAILERAWRDERPRLGWIGVPLGMLVLIRTPSTLFAGALALAALIRDRRALGWVVLGAAPAMAALLAYNGAIFHHPLGAYADAAARVSPWAWLPEGIAGLLVSPSHGLFLYSPVAALALLGLGRGADPATFALRACYALAFVALLVVHAASGSYAAGYPIVATWHGGWTWGPRYLLESVPLVTMLAWYGFGRIAARRSARILVGLAAACSIAVNAAPFYLGWTSWFASPDVDFCPSRLWSWRDNPVAALVWGLDPANACRPLRVTEPPFDPARTELTFREPGEWSWLTRGWHKRHWPWQAHAGGAEAEIEIPAAARATLSRIELRLRSALPAEVPQRVWVDLDGGGGRTLALGAEPTDVTVELPSGSRAPDEQPVRVRLRFAHWRARTWREIMREHRLGTEWDVRQDAVILDRLTLIHDPPPP